MITKALCPKTLVIEATVAARRPVVQIPTVELHTSVMTALGLANLTLITLRRPDRPAQMTAWLVGTDDATWEACPTPWHRTVRLSPSLHTLLNVQPGATIELVLTYTLAPLWPARIQRLLAGDEIGLHRDDARALGIRKWALVNVAGIPAVLRVRTTRLEADRGVARLSYQTRMLLGISPSRNGLRRQIHLGPFPQGRFRRPLLPAEPRWNDRATSLALRSARLPGVWVERVCALILRAPKLSFQTLEALPGEDNGHIVRLGTDLFPLLGTSPGQQVQIEWGPGNRTSAIALTSGELFHDRWPDTYIVGHRPDDIPRPADVGILTVGAATRASLGIPRITTVTVRRRILPLIAARLNELIVPATGLAIALAADFRPPWWGVVAGAGLILGLLIAPLRIRRTRSGRHA